MGEREIKLSRAKGGGGRGGEGPLRWVSRGLVELGPKREMGEMGEVREGKI